MATRKIGVTSGTPKCWKSVNLGGGSKSFKSKNKKLGFVKINEFNGSGLFQEPKGKYYQVSLSGKKYNFAKKSEADKFARKYMKENNKC
jgi:hypothetical protein